MDPIEGVDYAFSKPTPAALVAAGKRFACRYGYAGGSTKWLTAAEAHQLAAAGVWIVANVEGTAGGLVRSAVGRDWALNGARFFEALGMPKDRPVYLSVDFDCTAAQWPQVRDALAAACQAIGRDRVGVYGSYNVCQWAARDNVAAWFWQTYAWSHGFWMNTAQLRQYRNGVIIGGADCDLDRAVVADYGQWMPGVSAGGAMAAGDADKAFSEVYTGSEPWVSGKSWMAKAVEAPLTAIRAQLAAMATQLGTDIDVHALAVEIGSTVAAALVADPNNPLTEAHAQAVADAVADKLGARLARPDA